MKCRAERVLHGRLRSWALVRGTLLALRFIGAKHKVSEDSWDFFRWLQRFLGQACVAGLEAPLRSSRFLKIVAYDLGVFGD